MPRPRRKGFTLTELLVVLAILVVLLGIMAPSLGRARAAARTARCAAHLRQWGLALGLYVAESRQTLPEEGGTTTMSLVTYEHAWYNALPKYLGGRKYYDVYAGLNVRVGTKNSFGEVLTATAATGYPSHWVSFCPTALANRGKNTASSHLNSFHYTMNGVLDGHGAFGTDTPLPFHTGLARVPNPELTPFLFEVTSISYSHDGPDTLDVYRHGGRANVLLLDGHLELQPGRSLPIATKGADGVYRSAWPHFEWGPFR